MHLDKCGLLIVSFSWHTPRRRYCLCVGSAYSGSSLKVSTGLNFAQPLVKGDRELTQIANSFRCGLATTSTARGIIDSLFLAINKEKRVWCRAILCRQCRHRELGAQCTLDGMDSFLLTSEWPDWQGVFTTPWWSGGEKIVSISSVFISVCSDSNCSIKTSEGDRRRSDWKFINIVSCTNRGEDKRGLTEAK